MVRLIITVKWLQTGAPPVLGMNVSARKSNNEFMARKNTINTVSCLLYLSRMALVCFLDFVLSVWWYSAFLSLATCHPTGSRRNVKQERGRFLFWVWEQFLQTNHHTTTSQQPDSILWQSFCFQACGVPKVFTLIRIYLASRRFGYDEQGN